MIMYQLRGGGGERKTRASDKRNGHLLLMFTTRKLAGVWGGTALTRGARATRHSPQEQEDEVAGEICSKGCSG